jgi:hypothetical protein
MHQVEWAQIVARLNLNWPGQQISTQTADEWFEPLRGFPAAEVWDAIDRHRRDMTPGRDRTPAGHWAPSLAGILACVDANWRDRSAARRELEAKAARAARNGRGGVPMPPEAKHAMEVLRDSMAGRIDKHVARERIEALADQMQDRQDREKAGQLT